MNCVECIWITFVGSSILKSHLPFNTIGKINLLYRMLLSGSHTTTCWGIVVHEVLTVNWTFPWILATRRCYHSHFCQWETGQLISWRMQCRRSQDRFAWLGLALNDCCHWKMDDFQVISIDPIWPVSVLAVSKQPTDHFEKPDLSWQHLSRLVGLEPPPFNGKHLSRIKGSFNELTRVLSGMLFPWTCGVSWAMKVSGKPASIRVCSMVHDGFVGMNLVTPANVVTSKTHPWWDCCSFLFLDDLKTISSAWIEPMITERSTCWQLTHACMISSGCATCPANVRTSSIVLHASSLICSSGSVTFTSQNVSTGSVSGRVHGNVGEISSGRSSLVKSTCISGNLSPLSPKKKNPCHCPWGKVSIPCNASLHSLMKMPHLLARCFGKPFTGPLLIATPHYNGNQWLDQCPRRIIPSTCSSVPTASTTLGQKEADLCEIQRLKGWCSRGRNGWNSARRGASDEIW